MLKCPESQGGVLLSSLRGPSKRQPLQVGYIALTLALTSPAFGQTLDAKPAKQVSTKAIFLDYYRSISHGLGDSVIAVFDKTASKAVRDRVGAAMKLDTFQIEAMTTDATVMSVDKWRPSLEGRARILPIVQGILSLPEKDVDIWNVSMTLAKDAYPDLNVDHYNGEFQKLVEQIRRATPPDADPETRIRTINTILYKKVGITYDPDERELKQAVYNRYAFSILDRKHGNCYNLALLYIAVAQRLGYPVYPVSAPEHLFARWVDPAFKLQNIDPSGRGRFAPDEEYIRRMEIPSYAVKNGTYLRTMSYRELAGYMVADHGGFYYGEYLKDDVLAIGLMERGLDHSGKNSEYWCLLGARYNHWASQEWMPDVREIKFIRALVFMQKGMRMGLGKSMYQEVKERKEQEEGIKIAARPGV